ncbi:ATP-dependent lipid A-core flippase-like [Ciona intestinalis]
MKQYICIITTTPGILILDKATSTLDAESERLVQNAIDLVMVNRTVLVIAHPASMIKNTDVIAVKKGGGLLRLETTKI